MINNGKTGATFTVHDNNDAQEPWHYTIGAGDRFASEQWHETGVLTAYDLTLRGPNGYWRRYAGKLGADATPVEVSLVAHPADDAVELILSNGTATARIFTIEMDDRYPTNYERTLRISVAPGTMLGHRVRLAASDNWYDLTVTVDETDFLRRFAGKVDNGRAGRTDPGIGTMQIAI
jgi:phospholipase C